MRFIFNDDSYEIKLDKNDTKLDTETFEKMLNAMKEIKISQINREKELEIAKLNCDKDETISNSNNAKDLYSNLNRQLYCFPQLRNNY